MLDSVVEDMVYIHGDIDEHAQPMLGTPTEDIHARYGKLCMDFSGFTLCDGMIIAVIDSRGKVVKGVFRRISGNFIVLSSTCDSQPSYIIRHQYVAHIVILGSCYGQPANGSAVRYQENRESNNNTT